MSETTMPQSEPQAMYPTVGIVGVGLIGGSLGLVVGSSSNSSIESFRF
jgi:hypothetical protein